MLDVPAFVNVISVEPVGNGRAEILGWREQQGVGMDYTFAQNVPTPLARQIAALLRRTIAQRHQQTGSGTGRKGAP